MMFNRIKRCVSAVLIAAFFLPAGALSDQVISPEHSPATVFLSPALVLNASSLTGCFSRSPAGDIVLPRTKNTPGKEAPAATASKRVAGGYFYSPSTGQYISRTPLKIDASIKKAAMELGIPLWWNDDGRIGKISFIDARRLFDKLGMRLMSPTQYWQILADAYASGDEAMLKELRSRAFAEWLDVIFIRENGKYFMIEHPTITPAGEWDKNADRSRFVEIDMPKGRYAWFTFDSIKNIWKIINKKFGFPYKESVTEERGKTGTIYKFWDIYTDLVDKGVAGMRGYVTSSDTPSLDCAMPLTVQSAPLINIRPCRTELPAAPLDADLFDTLLSFMDTFDTAMNSRDYRGFYERKDDLIAFLSRQMPESARELIRSGQENVFIKTREKLTDILGFLRMYALSENEPAVAAALEAISADLFGVSASAVSDEEFSGFIVSSRERLQAALDPVRPKNIVFVMGHKNPDTDTVISSLFEAYRNQLRDPATVYIPVVQGSRIPDEVQALLRDKQLSEGIFLSDEPLYERAYASGQANWILVDQNVSEVQKFVISILDHHTPQEAALRQDAAKTIEIMGSTTAMVVQRFQGMGIDLTGELARICYGATLMDTENRSRSKMTLKDSLVMDRLAAAAGMNDRPGYPVATEFYQSLMSALLGIADADYLFERDYKDDWGFGFAVVKIKHLFDRHSGTVNNADFIRRLLDLARESNARQNLPLTLVKICDYEDDNETVFKERMYFIFGNNASEEFKRQTLLLFRTVLNNEFRDKSIAIAEQAEGDAVRFVEWDGVSRQLSRKKIAPVLQPVVQAFNRYFYSVDLGLYVSRDFLKMNNALRGAAHKLGIELSADAAGYVNYVSPYELYMLMDELGYSVLSLSDYVRVRNEAAQVHDRQMLASLESHDFVEVLGTVVLDYDPAAEQGTVVDHPRVTRTAPGKYEVRGERDRVNIPRAEPGLIDWHTVPETTGLPEKVFRHGEETPDEDTLSRYWSPRPGKESVFTRGSIFIYQIPCLDGKVLPTERQANMGVRVCRDTIAEPRVHVRMDNGHVITEIADEDGVSIYQDGLLRRGIDNVTEQSLELLQPVNTSEHMLDLPRYLRRMVPEPVYDILTNNRYRRVELHYGPREAVKEIRPDLLAGYSDHSAIDPDGALIGWYIKDNEQGSKDIIITHIRGQSKLMHLLYGLRFLGVPDNAVAVYDYHFDYEASAEEIITRAMKGKTAKIVAIGKSIFGRKLLRKIKFGEVLSAVRGDMALYGVSDIRGLLTRQLQESSADKRLTAERIREFTGSAYARPTLEAMQELLSRPLSPEETLTYWYYGDIVEDYLRLITMITTGTIESTKFAKWLQQRLPAVRISPEGVVIYDSGRGSLVRADLGGLLAIKDGRFINFRPQVSQAVIQKELEAYPELRGGVAELFRLCTMFQDISPQSGLHDYAAAESLQRLREKFDVKTIDGEIFGVHTLSYPSAADTGEPEIIPVGEYPFGSLSADFIGAAARLGAEKYVHAGSCGFFTRYPDDIRIFDLHPGDLIIPYEVYDKAGNLLARVNSQRIVEAARLILQRSRRPYRILEEVNGRLAYIEGESVRDHRIGTLNIILTRHVSVDSPLEEDQALIQGYMDKGIASVDCETAAVINRMHAQGKELDYEFMFWIADLPGQEGATLSSEKDLHPISYDTLMRKVQGLMSDIYTYLRFQDAREQTASMAEIPAQFPGTLPRGRAMGSVSEAISTIEKLKTQKKSVSDKPFKVLISGKSASGKTSEVARIIAEHFSVEVLSQDMYYYGREYNQKHDITSFDDPAGVELSRLKMQLQNAQSGVPFDCPVYSFENGGQRLGYKEFTPGEVLVVEGNFTLLDEIAAEGDFNIFVDVSDIGQFVRRLKRDGKEGRTGQSFQEILQQMFTQVIPAQREILVPTMRNADLIIPSSFDPEKEAPRIGIFEVQAKAELTVLPDRSQLINRLFRSGAEKIAAGIIQKDIYFTPKNQSLLESGETLRIREENGEYMLTYKGPRVKSVRARQKPKMEMPFDKELFPYVYETYDVLDVIEKERTVFRKGGLVISLDHVQGVGDYIEISGQVPEQEAQIIDLFHQLGIGREQITTASYLDLKQRYALLEKFRTREDLALIFLKGGNQGGVHPQLKKAIIERLSEWFEIVEGQAHEVSFNEMLTRWGKGYLYYHFLKPIEENPALDDAFKQQLRRAIAERNEALFNDWLKQARIYAHADTALQRVLRTYDYYASRGQQLMLKLRPGIRLPNGDKPLQQFVKETIVGKTFCFDAEHPQLRAIVADALRDQDMLSFVIDAPLRMLDNADAGSKRLLSSIFNGIHCPDAGAELLAEVTTFTNRDVLAFNQFFEQEARRRTLIHSEKSGKFADAVLLIEPVFISSAGIHSIEEAI